MNTKQIIKQMEKELAIHEWGAECLGSVSDYMEPIDKIVKPHIHPP